MTRSTNQWWTEIASKSGESVQIMPPRERSTPYAGVRKTSFGQHRAARGFDMRSVFVRPRTTEHLAGFQFVGLSHDEDDVAADTTFHERILARSTILSHQSVGTTPHPSDQDALLASVAKRMTELQEAADEDGVTLLQASIDGLHGFVERSGATRMPLLTLRPEGNLRALWDRPDGEQIGLQFLDRFRIGYVLFSRALDGTVDHHFGTVSRSRLLPLIRHFRLSALLVD